jgi:hypothetical protein
VDDRTVEDSDQPPVPSDPVAAMPPRRPGSVRRTSHVDMVWDEDGPGTLRLVGAARDVRTDRAGVGAVLAAGTLEARADDRQRLSSLATDPEHPGNAALLGHGIRGGFRAAVRSARPETAGRPLGLLLDDIPVAALIASYALQRRAATGPTGTTPVPPEAAAHQADLCAGWDATGTMIRSISAGRGLPYRTGPAAPPVTTDDPLDWHAEPPLPPGAMRRRRRIDVLDGGVRRIDAFFRDTWVRDDGTEEVLHEYTVEARLDGDDTIAAVFAWPRVLPFGECPRAAAHVGRLVGSPVGDLRRLVPDRLAGISSCTHLNDLLRALGDVPALERLLDA